MLNHIQLHDTLMQAANPKLSGLIDNGRLANQIGTLVAIVIRKVFMLSADHKL